MSIKKVMVSLDEGMLRQLDILTDQTTLTRSAVLRVLLRNHINKPGNGYILNYHGATLWSDGRQEVPEVTTTITEWCDNGCKVN